MCSITPESRQLVDLYMRSELLKIQPGEMTYGTDPSKWPAKFVDAMEILKLQDLSERNARMEAERT